MPLPPRHERSSLATVDTVLHRIKQKLLNIQIHLQSTRTDLEEIKKQLSDLLNNLDRLSTVLDRNLYVGTRESIIAIEESVQNELSQRRALNDGRQETDNIQSQATNTSAAVSVRPKLPRASNSIVGNMPKRGARNSDINKETLERLLSLGMTVKHIANAGLLGGQVHRNTIHNFMLRNGMQRVRERYATISDTDLKLIIEELSRQYPNSGSNEMLSLLRSKSPPLIIQRDRCRKILAEVDPLQFTNNRI
jgi:hypothetical protein